MDDKVLWIWLAERMQRDSLKITELLSVFDDVSEIYRQNDFSAFGFLNQKQKTALMDKNTEDIDRIIQKTKDINAEILTYNSPEYPDMLRRIDDPPYVLYIKGEKMKWDRLMTIAVVGTRSYTEYGLNATWAICTGLARAGITIVSGMARGLDSVASAAAIRAGCRTIVVLGCGLDIVYPPENADLMEKILKRGAVISEYPPSTRPIGKHFPQRNRIISGLSRGTLVVQAPPHSGALITASYALDTGRDVFAVPGDINLTESRGTNGLIKQGAKLVESSKDILEEYQAELELLEKPEDMESYFDAELVLLEKPEDAEFEYEPTIKEKKKKTAGKQKPINNEKIISIEDERYSRLEDDEKSIIEQLIKNNMHIDDIQRNTNISVDKLATKLTVLEMQGFIVQMPGKLFRINI